MKPIWERSSRLTAAACSPAVLALFLLFCTATPKIGNVQRMALDKSLLLVRDGDTVSYREQEIRFLGVDCPEGSHKWFDGNQEPWAGKAREFTALKIRKAETVEADLIDSRDPYGRRLGHLFVDGESLSLLLVTEGLAYENVSHYGDNGFPDLAERIRESARGRRPPFEAPWVWRKKHQTKK